jgi:hypothetical protein
VTSQQARRGETAPRGSDDGDAPAG